MNPIFTALDIAKRFTPTRFCRNSSQLGLLVMFVLSISLSACYSTQTNNTTLDNKSSEHVFYSEFNELPLGLLQNKDLHNRYPQLQWASLHDRMSVVYQDTQKVLAVDYPKGAVGPQNGGAQFVIDLPAKTAYTLRYSLKFAENFDFRIGGKLPGLTSGGEKWTGGVRPLNGEGFSARLMWRENGRAELYLYYIDMKGKWGESIDFGNYIFVPGKWYEISQQS